MSDFHLNVPLLHVCMCVCVCLCMYVCMCVLRAMPTNPYWSKGLEKRMEFTNMCRNQTFYVCVLNLFGSVNISVLSTYTDFCRNGQMPQMAQHSRGLS